MDLEEYRQTDDYKDAPKVIKMAIEILPPLELYKVKETGFQCFILAYYEPRNGMVNDVEMLVEKTGLSTFSNNVDYIDSNCYRVRGYKVTDLEIWTEEEVM